MTKREQLEENVVDTKAAWEAAYGAAWDAFDAAAEHTAWDAWFKAKLELANYLQGKDND